MSPLVSFKSKTIFNSEKKLRCLRKHSFELISFIKLVDEASEGQKEFDASEVNQLIAHEKMNIYEHFLIRVSLF